MQKYINNVQDVNGRAISSARVTVYTLAGSVATIYSDDGITTQNNPIQVNSAGMFSFYAADGRYTLSILANGQTTTISDVLLEDPQDGSDAVFGDVTVTLLEATDAYDKRDIRFYGAVGDGVTDDTAAFTSASASGLSVFIPKPSTSYYVTSLVEGDFWSTDDIIFTGLGLSLVKKSGSPFPRAQKKSSAAMIWNVIAGSAITNKSTALTYGVKFEAEAIFDSVALLWQNYETNTVPNVKAIVAMSETFSTASQDTQYRPVVNGVTYNIIRNSTDDYGWSTVTWSGASTVTLPAASGAYGGQTVTISDFIPCGSVPRSDGGTRPILLYRVYLPGTANYTVTSGATSYSNLRIAGTYNRNRLIDASISGGDGVGSPATTMGAGVSDNPLVSPIFRFRDNVVSVYGVGDSITAGQGSTTSVGGWLKRACYDLSTMARPVVPCNLGHNSQPTSTYLAVARVVFPLAKPSVAFYFPYSPNSAVYSERAVRDNMAQAAEFVTLCNDYNVVPILCTPVPNNNLNAADDAFRKEYCTLLRAMASDKNILMCDFDLYTSDGATPARFISGYNADALHPNNTGYEAMTYPAKLALAKAIYGY